MKAIVNEIGIRAKCINALKKRQFVGLAHSAANTRFQFAKQDLLNDYDEHPVTQELLAGPYTNDSNFVSPKGNLASFLGFTDSSLEVGKLRSFLEDDNNINMDEPEKVKITNDSRKIYYEFKVHLPTKELINETFETPEKWSSRGWPYLIEEGISNIIYYIFRAAGLPEKAKSRSGTGLQWRKKLDDPKVFHPTKFLTEIFDKFRKRFR